MVYLLLKIHEGLSAEVNSAVYKPRLPLISVDIFLLRNLTRVLF